MTDDDLAKRMAATTATRQQLFDQDGKLILAVDLTGDDVEDPSVVLPKGRTATTMITTFADGHIEDTTYKAIGLPAPGNDGVLTLVLDRRGFPRLPPAG